MTSERFSRVLIFKRRYNKSFKHLLAVQKVKIYLKIQYNHFQQIIMLHSKCKHSIFKYTATIQTYHKSLRTFLLLLVQEPTKLSMRLTMRLFLEALVHYNTYRKSWKVSRAYFNFLTLILRVYFPEGLLSRGLTLI